MDTTPPSSSPLILNVDDSDGGRYVKSRILRLAGYTVIEASSGQEALDKVAAQLPLLVLLDVKLPDINGLEVCRRLKADPVTARTLVLQTSAALVETIHKVQALDGGADSYLAEPIEPTELVANVRALLRLRAAEDAQRVAVRALQESEERFQQFANSVNDVFWIYEPGETRFLYVSPAYEREWHGSANTLLDDAGQWFERVVADEREPLRAAFGLLGSSPGFSLEYRMRDVDGRERWIAERAFPVDGPTGQALRVAGISHDFTVRKQAELRLTRSDRRKDEFLAMLAHELRNPLEPIRTATAVLAQSGSLGSPDESKAVAVIERQVNHLTRLVEDLLDVSRVTHGKIQLRLAPVRLDEVISSAVDANHEQADRRALQIVIDLPDEPIWILGDTVRLTQIFSNLVHNATKFSTGGSTLTLHARRSENGHEAVVAVRDQGIGIAADMIDSVFDLFTQEDQSPARNAGGLGIGLSVVRSMAELHGGSVSVHSAGPGRGTEFLVTLPTTQPPPVAVPVVHSTVVRSRRILVVDDSPDAAELMQCFLEMKGHTVRLAYGGEEALATAATMAPEFVVLDIGLPDITGYEVARRLKATTGPDGPVLIALTGYGSELDRSMVKDAGFDHHLVKPADHDMLLAIFNGTFTDERA